SSSNASVASVSQSGYVFGNGTGSATITAKYTENGTQYISTSVVTVTAPAVSYSSLSVSPTSASISVGATKQLVATAHYSDSTTKTVTTSGTTYSSSNSGVATVNATGLVTGKGAGSTDITATYIEGGVLHSAISKITVSVSFMTCTLELVPSPYDSVLVGATDDILLRTPGGQSVIPTSAYMETGTTYLSVTGNSTDGFKLTGLKAGSGKINLYYNGSYGICAGWSQLIYAVNP
ncbi:Ig-like domain-containing protein, partial [Aeromonas enterica]